MLFAQTELAIGVVRQWIQVRSWRADDWPREKGSQAGAWLPGWCSVFCIAARGFVAVAVFGTKPSVAAVDDEVHAAMFRRAHTSNDCRALRPVTRPIATAGDDPAIRACILEHVHLP